MRRWDHGGRNSYRMGAEGKFDLKVVSGGSTGATGATGGGATVASGAAGEGARGGRKSHSTPSLPDATAVDHQVYFYFSWILYFEYYRNTGYNPVAAFLQFKRAIITKLRFERLYGRHIALCSNLFTFI